MKIEEARVSSVAALNNRTDLNFVSDSQDVEAIHDYIPKSKPYDAFFIKQRDGDYVEVWGMVGSVPYLSKMVTKLYDASQNHTKNKKRSTGKRRSR